MIEEVNVCVYIVGLFYVSKVMLLRCALSYSGLPSGSSVHELLLPLALCIRLSKQTNVCRASVQYLIFTFLTDLSPLTQPC